MESLKEKKQKNVRRFGMSKGRVKKFFVTAAAFTALGLLGVASDSFAAAQLNAGNTFLAAEKISPTTDYTAPSVNTAYQTGGPVAASTVIKISLANGKFVPGTTIDICDNFGNSMGSGTVPSAPNNNYVEITLTNPLASGTVYTIQDDGCAGLATPLSSIIVPAGTGAGTVISMTVDNKLIPGDPNVYATAPVITVKNQFSATLKPVTSKLDFATNMERFKSDPSCTSLPCTTDTESKAALLIESDESINDKVTVTAGGGSCDRQLAAGDSLVVKITGNLQGLGNINYVGATTTSSYTITNTDRTNGYATLTVAGNNLSICKSTDSPKVYRALVLTADDTTGTPIIPGTRTAQITIKGGGNIASGYSRDLIPAGTPSHIIQLDATQYYIPLIKYNPAAGEETYIKLQSKSTIGGANGVLVQILASDGSLVPYNAGTITSGTPLLITGSQLVSAVTSAGKTVDGSQGFAVIVTVNAPEADVFAYANTCSNAAGCKRIPVKTVDGKIVE
jgi:hypothetical protein